MLRIALTSFFESFPICTSISATWSRRAIAWRCASRSPAPTPGRSARLAADAGDDRQQRDRDHRVVDGGRRRPHPGGHPPDAQPARLVPNLTLLQPLQRAGAIRAPSGSKIPTGAGIEFPTHGGRATSAEANKAVVRGCTTRSERGAPDVVDDLRRWVRGPCARRHLEVGTDGECFVGAWRTAFLSPHIDAQHADDAKVATRFTHWHARRPVLRVPADGAPGGREGRRRLQRGRRQDRVRLGRVDMVGLLQQLGVAGPRA
jgi:hypothetical protein